MSSPPPSLIPPSTVIPFPLPWGQTGCCPPGGMDALMKCYCDIQAASAFIGQILIDQINNNPAVTEAIIAAIEKSGSNLPLIGVTNGSDAQPGQVGEWYRTMTPLAIPVAAQVLTLALGVLQPGDWDCWVTIAPAAFVSTLQIELNPQPAGFSDNMYANVNSSGQNSDSLFGGVTRASISVPTLVSLQVGTNQYGTGTAPTTANIEFSARRMR